MTVRQSVAPALGEELDQIVSDVLDYDAQFRQSYKLQMGYAFLAGVRLNRAKEILPHGTFLEWREAELPEISRSSASRYSQFAEALSKDPTVGSLQEVKLLMDGKALSDKAQSAIATAVHNYADGKTLTQMYRDLGMVRQPKKQEYHPPRMTDEQRLAAAREDADELVSLHAGRARTWIEEMAEDIPESVKHQPTLMICSSAKRAELLRVNVELNKLLRRLQVKKGGRK